MWFSNVHESSSRLVKPQTKIAINIGPTLFLFFTKILCRANKGKKKFKKYSLRKKEGIWQDGSKLGNDAESFELLGFNTLNPEIKI